MENLEKITKVLRYAGLNITPQMVSLALDDELLLLIKTMKAKVEDSPNLTVNEIEEVISEFQKRIKTRDEPKEKEL